MIQCHFNKYLQKLREKGLARKNLAKQGTPVRHSNHDKQCYQMISSMPKSMLDISRPGLSNILASNS